MIGSLAPETQCVTNKPPTPLLRQRWARLVSPTPHFTGGETEAWRGKVWPEVRRELRRASRPPGSLTSVLAVLGGGAGSCRTSPPPPALSWCPAPPGPGRRTLLTLGHIRTVGPLTLEGLGSKGTPGGAEVFLRPGGACLPSGPGSTWVPGLRPSLCGSVSLSFSPQPWAVGSHEYLIPFVSGSRQGILEPPQQVREKEKQEGLGWGWEWRPRRLGEGELTSVRPGLGADGETQESERPRGSWRLEESRRQTLHSMRPREARKSALPGAGKQQSLALPGHVATQGRKG